MTTPYSYRVEYENKLQIIPSQIYETVAHFTKTIRQRFNIPFEIELTSNDAVICPDDTLLDLHLDTKVSAIRARQRLVNHTLSVNTPRLTRALNHRLLNSVAPHNSNSIQMQQISSISRINAIHDPLKQPSSKLVMQTSQSQDNTPQQISHSVSFTSPRNLKETPLLDRSPIHKTTSETLLKSCTYSFKFNTSTAAYAMQKKHDEYKQSFYIDNNESDTDKED